MNNLDYQLDNDGNLYLLTKVFHDDSNQDKKSKKDLSIAKFRKFLKKTEQFKKRGDIYHFGVFEN